MALTYTQITETFLDGTGQPLNNIGVSFAPSQTVYASGVPVVTPNTPITAEVVGGVLKSPSGGTLQLLDTSNAGLTVESGTGFWVWTVTITGQLTDSWSFFLPHSASPVDLYTLRNSPAGGSQYVPLAGGTMTGALSVPDLIVQGLAGATAASRLVGATTSGAPVSGTFLLGDLVVDQTGKVWICTVAGTPGTWTAAGPTIPVTIAQGGTGQTTQQAALDAIAGAVTASQVLAGNGTHVTLRAMAAADLPAATTSAQGAVQLDATAADMQPTGVASTGKTPILKVVYADHVHPYEPWQFYIPPIGGGTDDTANLRTLINNALTYMANNQGYAEWWMDPFIYTVAAATLKNITNKGNSQLPLNPVGNTGLCQRLVLRSTGGGAPPNPNFAATGAQLGAGPVLLSTLTAQAFDGTWGAPSVLGGPTPQQGFGYNGGSPNFSNLMIDMQGITVMTQGPNPTMIGFDFRGLTKMSVSGASLVDATVSQMSSTQPTNSWAYGLTSPDAGNSDLSDIGTWTTYGYYWGMELSEHANAQRITAIYNNAGLALNAGPGQRGFEIGYLSAESNQSHVISYNGSSAPLFIGHMDTEGHSHYAGGGFHIDDTGGTLYGHVGLSTQNGPSNFAINGCANLEIIAYEDSNRSVQAAPSYTLGTPFQNPWWRHMSVELAGGTVTGIKTGPTAATVSARQGTSGNYRLPSGWWMEIDGSVKPTTFNAIPD